MKNKEKLPFRWHYVIIPVVIFFLSLLIACYFYPQLSGKEIAAHFDLKGIPDRFSGSSSTLAWMMGVQLCFMALAVGIVHGLTRMSIISELSDDSPVTPGKLLSFMGNLIGLPQIIISFAMFDILWYALYRTHLMPLWLFTLIILAIAAFVPLILGIFVFVKRKGTAKPQGE